MDYKTKPLSREMLRRYAAYFRELFDVDLKGAFPVLEALEKIGDVFEGCNYIVLPDEEFDNKTMARCVPNDSGGFTIEIRETVYIGAYEKQIGAFLGFICHELCHVFLFYIGYTAIFERSFRDNTIDRCCSVEWQAKALSGEVMIPFEESKNMKREELMKYYHVSKGFADFRRILAGVPRWKLMLGGDDV